MTNKKTNKKINKKISRDINDEISNNINLGGFPPIFKITHEVKKKREFNNISKSFDNSKLNILNILNIKDIIKK